LFRVWVRRDRLLLLVVQEQLMVKVLLLQEGCLLIGLLS
jgi:hypothetical protein